MKKSNKSKSGGDKNKTLSATQILSKTKWDLALFYISIMIYFMFYVDMEQQNFIGMLLKCLPILALIYFAFKNGIEHPFKQKIFLALIFSCIGDGLLDFPGYFMHGTIAFAISQILTIAAYGFEPFNLSLGLKIFGVMGLPFPLILPKLVKAPTSLIMTVLCYMPCLMIMIWRAISRVGHGTSNYSSVRKISKIGAISFGVSDTVLALNKFFTPIPFAQPIIMFTYYLAQMGLAVSTVEYK